MSKISKKLSVINSLTVFFLILFGVFPAISLLAQESPLDILLTWKEDSITTMSLDRHHTSGEKQTLYYRLKGNTDWKKNPCNAHNFPFSDYSNPIEGTQTNWFKEGLAVRDGVTHLVTMYHVPTYPSGRDLNGNIIDSYPL